MAANITRLLGANGCLYVSVPHAWKFHGYPSDYWRFTPEGVKKLFPDLSFDESVAVSYTHLDVYKRQAYHCSGFTGKTAILGIDGKGEYATTFFGYGENGKIHKIKERCV